MGKEIAISAGLMRHSVELQTATYAADSVGQLIPTWETVATIRCLVEPVQGVENVNADQLRGEVTHRVTMRYQGSSLPITVDKQLIFQGTRTLRIMSVINVMERDKKLVLMCKEITTGDK